MTDVVISGKEDFESLLKRFNRKVQQNGIMPEVRRREFFEKPSIKRKEATKRRKSARASRKSH